jgi:microcin C transport system ATP-binding protein
LKRASETVGVVGESSSGKTSLGWGTSRLIKSEGPIVYLAYRIDKIPAKELNPCARIFRSLDWD